MRDQNFALLPAFWNMLLSKTSHGPQETFPITLEHNYKDGLNWQSNCSFMRTLFLLKKTWLKIDTTEMLSKISFFDFFASYLLQMSMWKQRFICLCYFLYKNVLSFSIFIHAKPQGKRERGRREHREDVRLSCAVLISHFIYPMTPGSGITAWWGSQAQISETHLCFPKYVLWLIMDG